MTSTPEISGDVGEKLKAAREMEAALRRYAYALIDGPPIAPSNELRIGGATIQHAFLESARAIAFLLSRVRELTEHREHVKAFLEELAEYLGLEGDTVKPADFIKAAADIRQGYSEKMDRIGELEGALKEEREACAQIADARAVTLVRTGKEIGWAERDFWAENTKLIAKAIRDRSKAASVLTRSNTP